MAELKPKTQNSGALTFWFPELLHPQRVIESLEEIKNQEFPALQTLLSKADYHVTNCKSFEERASFLFHQNHTPPSAITRAVVECDLSKEQLAEFWLSVDPVQMIPDRDTLVLIPGEDIGITEAESKALLQAFNQHFRQDGVKLLYGSATRWYLSIKQTIDIHTTSLSQVAFSSVNDHYPTGNAANYWRQLMNEAQMLFFTHEINEVRRSQNLPEINSIWLWGEGLLDLKSVQSRPQARIFSNDCYLQGLAKLADSDSGAFIPTFHQWWSDRSKSDSLHDLVHYSSNIKLEQMTQQEWLECLQTVEKDWAMPVLQALKSKQLKSVVFELGANKYFHLTPGHLKRFWRLKKSWIGLVN